MRRLIFGLAVFALAAPLPLLAETTDRQIAKQIVEQLKIQKESGELKGFNLDLQVEDGAVYLKGFVSEREQRRKAIDVARQVEGVKQVFNEIEVKTVETVKKVPARKLAGAAKKPVAQLVSRELQTPPEPPQVNVEPISASDKGTSRLSEAVVTTAVAPEIPINTFRTPRPIQVIGGEAMETSGAAETPSARQITEQIVDQYRSAMKRGELQDFGINVEVDKGIVWLKGTVANRAQHEYAIEVARFTPGVTKVIDALNITGAPDAQLASHDGSDEGVQHAFRQESHSRGNDAESERIAKAVVDGLQQQKQEGQLSNFGIDVQVDGRVVWMSGYVQNAEQHARALDVAAYTPDVEKVVNDLKIQSQGAPLRPVSATLPASPAQPAPGQQVMNYQMVPLQYMPVQAAPSANQTPRAFAPARAVNHTMQPGQPVPMTGNAGVGIAPARFDHPQMPGYAWPSYAPSPNYGAVTYPKQYSPSAWPYIGPFYPYPQVPLGWRRVTLEWDDGWWNLKFKNTRMH